MDADDLFTSYQFSDAVKAYERHLEQNIGSKWANKGGLGTALMAAGSYRDAIPYLEAVAAYERSGNHGGAGRDIELSVYHWMIGDHDQGLKIIKESVVAVRDRVVRYADAAGGVSQGVMLWYMAEALNATRDIDLARTFLIARANNKLRITSWPGPAALILLKKWTFEQAVEDGTGTADLSGAKAIAETDLRKRRKLTNALFAAALERRMAGDEAQCKAYMISCASLTNPLIEYEWHLAKHEATKYSPKT
jgi:tetratricopeptide (TPR) repeat protein